MLGLDRGKCAVIAVAASLFTSAANADNFSFTGSFTNDNDVQLFSFTAVAASTITLRTWSYAGGINAAGASIARGGFDPILALFNSSGALIGQNDDGGPALVATDLSGQAWDTFFTALIGPGSYTVAVMQYNNFALGPNLSNGFTHDGGPPNFTAGLTGCLTAPFCDVSGGAFNDRDGHWAF